MNFAIYGVNFYNKGAELMLHAVKQQINQWDKDNDLCAQLLIGDFQKRKQLGVKHLAWIADRERKKPLKSRTANFAASLIPKRIREPLDIVLDSEVDIILDASGFAFSDQWGPAKTERMAEQCFRWKKQGKKIILLPQAFGPFTNKRIQKAFIKMLDNVDIVFARDEISYEYISKLSVSMDKVKLAPDFTNLLQGIQPDYIKDLQGKPCIIPNQRMLDKTSPEVRDKYVSFLASSIQHMLDKGLQPFILIHEFNDSKLGMHLKAQLNQEIAVIEESNPLHLKGILGESYLVIGSRFHGLISSLSQGTPCLGTGWSHKYQMLFKNYNCSELLIDVADDIDKNLGKLDLLLNEDTRAKIIESVEQGAREQKNFTKQMWDEVEYTI